MNKGKDILIASGPILQSIHDKEFTRIAKYSYSLYSALLLLPRHPHHKSNQRHVYVPDYIPQLKNYLISYTTR